MDMTQEELAKLWNDTKEPVLSFSIWEGKRIGSVRFVCRMKEDYQMALPKGYPEYYIIPTHHTPYHQVRPGQERSVEERSHWQQQIDGLKPRSLKSPIHGSRAEAYSLIERFMELNDWGGGQPPACTEERCYEEEIFQDFLKIAEQNFLRDMAAALGYRITGLEESKPPYKE